MAARRFVPPATPLLVGERHLPDDVLAFVSYRARIFGLWMPRHDGGDVSPPRSGFKVGTASSGTTGSCTSRVVVDGASSSPPRLSVDGLSPDVRAKIKRLTAQDNEVYAAGFRRFAEAAGVVEAATGTQVLCARDIQPATRSALGATTAGRRLVAALDAGALPQPKPGLLPRRADGVGKVEPACSFH